MGHPRRVPPPIINIGRFRLDLPGYGRGWANTLKFWLFVTLLLGIFVLLSHLQARWLTAHNARETVPATQRLLAAPGK